MREVGLLVRKVLCRRISVEAASSLTSRPEPALPDALPAVLVSGLSPRPPGTAEAFDPLRQALTHASKGKRCTSV
jgi:hypothetical protein